MANCLSFTCRKANLYTPVTKYCGAYCFKPVSLSTCRVYIFVVHLISHTVFKLEYFFFFLWFILTYTYQNLEFFYNLSKNYKFNVELFPLFWGGGGGGGGEFAYIHMLSQPNFFYSFQARSLLDEICVQGYRFIL